MPELPEVESLRRGLERVAVGRVIQEVRCRQPRAINLPQEEFSLKSQGLITGVARKGKSAIVSVPKGTVWLHLGLTGRMAHVRPGGSAAQGVIDFFLDDGSILSMEQSFMGHAYFVPPEKFQEEWDALGIDALDPTLDAERLGEILDKKRRLAIKAVLMDQAAISGIGNVYSDEIAHRAHVHPLTRAGELTHPQVAAVATAIRSVLTQAVEEGGEGYVDLFGNVGGYRLLVHGQERCAECGSPTERSQFRGRSGYSCPRCQPRAAA